MDGVLFSLTLVILLRAANVRLAPLLRSWGMISLDELFDLHEVLCQKEQGDYWATQVCLALEGCFDWGSLSRGHAVLKEQWYRYVRQNVPPAVSVLSAGEKIEKTAGGPQRACLCDGGETSWHHQCEQILEHLHCENSSLVELVPASMMDTQILGHVPASGNICDPLHARCNILSTSSRNYLLIRCGCNVVTYSLQ